MGWEADKTGPDSLLPCHNIVRDDIAKVCWAEMDTHGDKWTKWTLKPVTIKRVTLKIGTLKPVTM